MNDKIMSAYKHAKQDERRRKVYADAARHARRIPARELFRFGLIGGLGLVVAQVVAVLFLMIVFSIAFRDELEMLEAIYGL